MLDNTSALLSRAGSASTRVLKTTQSFLAGATPYALYRSIISATHPSGSFEPEPEPEPAPGPLNTYVDSSWRQRHHAALAHSTCAPGTAPYAVTINIPDPGTLLYLAEATFDYHPPHIDHEHDLSLSRGDLIEVLLQDVQEMGTGWNLGRVDGRCGFFPANHTQPAAETVETEAVEVDAADGVPGEDDDATVTRRNMRRQYRRADVVAMLDEAEIAEITRIRVLERAKKAALEVPISIRQTVIAELETAVNEGRQDAAWGALDWSERLAAVQQYLLRRDVGADGGDHDGADAGDQLQVLLGYQQLRQDEAEACSEQSDRPDYSDAPMQTMGTPPLAPPEQQPPQRPPTRPRGAERLSGADTDRTEQLAAMAEAMLVNMDHDGGDGLPMASCMNDGPMLPGRPKTSHGRGRTPNANEPPMVAADEYDEELRRIAHYEQQYGHIKGSHIPEEDSGWEAGCSERGDEPDDGDTATYYPTSDGFAVMEPTAYPEALRVRVQLIGHL